MLPPMSASNGSIILLSVFWFCSAASAETTVIAAEILMGRLGVVTRNQHGEHRRQEHENKGLDETDQNFHEIKWDRQEPGQRRDNVGHRFEHDFARINISEQTKTQRDRPKQYRNDFEPADCEKDYHHDNF